MQQAEEQNNMRIFVFSRRFLIVFFAVWILHLFYFTWQFWSLYGADFKNKDIPSSFIVGFIWHSLASYAVGYSFLAAILVATAFCFHQLKKKGGYYSPFSIGNMIAVLIIALAGFFYISFTEPRSKLRSRQLISAIVFARPGEKPNVQEDVGNKSVTMMTLPELVKERKAIALRKEDKTSPEYLYKLPGSIFRWVDWEIGKKIQFPLLLILFYIMGALLGISLSRTYVIWVILLGYFVLFTALVFVNYFFADLYRLNRIGIVTGLGMLVILPLLICGFWYFILRKKGGFRDREKETLDELLTRENSEHSV